MRIFIITMDDPVQTNEFIKKIIDEKEEEIIGIAITYRDRLTLTKGRSKFIYIFSLLLIMGPFYFSKNVMISMFHKSRKLGARFKLCSDPTLFAYAKDKSIPAFMIKSPNTEKFRFQLQKLKPDIIINQSQNILKKELLQIPSIGVINRHNALLPKNRGRMTPFWVLFRGEKETGVSIHFVSEGLDDGDIIVQERIQVDSNETFNSLVKKNYEVAPRALIKAINLLKTGTYELIPNNDELATYNSIPTFKDAFNFRIHRLFRIKK